MGFGLVIGFIKTFQIVTTIDYSAIANLHILQFTRVRTKSFQCAVFTGCRLVTASNVADSSARLIFNHDIIRK
jgi:hypothetical protein